jgi:hypothetical protein
MSSSTLRKSELPILLLMGSCTLGIELDYIMAVKLDIKHYWD